MPINFPIIFPLNLSVELRSIQYNTMYHQGFTALQTEFILSLIKTPDEFESFFISVEELLHHGYHSFQIYDLIFKGGLSKLHQITKMHNLLAELHFTPMQIVTISRYDTYNQNLNNIFINYPTLKLFDFSPQDLTRMLGCAGGTRNINFLIHFANEIKEMGIQNHELVDSLSDPRRCRTYRDKLNADIETHIGNRAFELKEVSTKRKRRLFFIEDPSLETRLHKSAHIFLTDKNTHSDSEESDSCCAESPLPISPEESIADHLDKNDEIQSDANPAETYIDQASDLLAPSTCYEDSQKTLDEEQTACPAPAEFKIEDNEVDLEFPFNNISEYPISTSTFVLFHPTLDDFESYWKFQKQLNRTTRLESEDLGEKGVSASLRYNV